ncbi:hypothetical protein B5G50_23685 [Brevibacillus brevis]|nr:hypothetical protein B5G50_23685 [Brevibacillus brevis]
MPKEWLMFHFLGIYVEFLFTTVLLYWMLVRRIGLFFYIQDSKPFSCNFDLCINGHHIFIFVT